MFDNSDPEMQGAYEQARATFRYFWREVAWEHRRIIPGLDLACVKAPFSDVGRDSRATDSDDVEHMWLGEVEFDGQFISGVLLNAPNALKSVKEGDPARIPVGEISDWMYVIGGDVSGAYTVNLMRSRMGARERKEHDEAWGLHFGDPRQVRVVPGRKKSGGRLHALFGRGGDAEIPEHPMSENMVSSLKAILGVDPSMLHALVVRGWTLLHQLALAGCASNVRVLLEAGADPNAVTDHGMTPMRLARSLDWEKVVALLEGR
jgi:uncharacterized protein YegJ (DUF2314 family)